MTILSLGTATPTCRVPQEEAADLMIDFLGIRGTKADRLRALYESTRIKSRSTVMSTESGRIDVPFFREIFSSSPVGMTRRTSLYKENAPRLAYTAASKAIGMWGGDPRDITHVISISSTGVITPGLEVSLVNDLQLRHDTFRLGINFMGCFGALKGLAAAKAFAKENPKNRILMVCTELCSLHMQPGNELGVWVSNALFADGAAAAVIGSSTDKNPGLYRLEDHRSCFIEDTLDLMQWNGSDYGLQITLSKKVPEKINSQLIHFVEDLLHTNGVTSLDCEWAVHPGGRAIVEGVEEQLGLTKENTAHSWDILEKYGNMSSPTVLFVLEKLSQNLNGADRCFMLGFGPGLSMEGILLCRDQRKKS